MGCAEERGREDLRSLTDQARASDSILSEQNKQRWKQAEPSDKRETLDCHGYNLPATVKSLFELAEYVHSSINAAFIQS